MNILRIFIGINNLTTIIGKDSIEIKQTTFGHPLLGKRVLETETSEMPKDLETLNLLLRASKKEVWPDRTYANQFTTALVLSFKRCIRNTPQRSDRNSLERYIDLLTEVRDRTEAAAPYELKETIKAIIKELKSRPQDYELLFWQNFYPERLTRREVREKYLGIPRGEIPKEMAKERVRYFEYDSDCSFDAAREILTCRNKRYRISTPLKKRRPHPGEMILTWDSLVVKIGASLEDYYRCLMACMDEIALDRREERELYEEAPRTKYDHLARIRRISPFDYRHGRNVSPEELLETFGLYGGEFGNWVTELEQVEFINMTYDALADLSYICQIDPKCIGLGGGLGLSFGSRGQLGASAHFERTTNVINLTRFNGSGSLAHEWFHALDCYLLQVILGIPFGLYSQVEVEVSALKKLIEDHTRAPSEYYLNSLMVAREAGVSYPVETHEMLARAFSCFCIDTLEQDGSCDNFLAEEKEARFDGEGTINPRGLERLEIDHLFRELFSELCSLGYLKALQPDHPLYNGESPEPETSEEQLRFF